MTRFDPELLDLLALSRYTSEGEFAQAIAGTWEIRPLPGEFEPNPEAVNFFVNLGLAIYEEVLLEPTSKRIDFPERINAVIERVTPRQFADAMALVFPLGLSRRTFPGGDAHELLRFVQSYVGDFARRTTERILKDWEFQGRVVDSSRPRQKIPPPMT